MGGKVQMGGMLRVGAALILAAVIAVTTGCGSSSSADSATGQTEASKQFLSPKGNNEIPKFGKEADSGERKAASAVLAENLKARAAHDWAGQCATLTAKVAKGFAERGAY